MTGNNGNSAGLSTREKQGLGSTNGHRRSGNIGTAPKPLWRVKRRVPRRTSGLLNHSMFPFGFLLICLTLLLVPGHLFGQDYSSAFSDILNGEAGVAHVSGWVKQVCITALRLSFAAVLAAILAFRPRRILPTVHRNPYVRQTQILLSVVGAALMMIVADNAVRAFGIFAATSLVRFRTNIRDPKEITVLLINLGIGLATGVGRLDLAIMLCLFVLMLLLLLEYHEARQMFRAMQLKVKTRDSDQTDHVLRELFERHNISAELYELEREGDESAFGKVVYRADVSANVDTDGLSEEIFSADSENIDSIEWQQKKKASSYIYH